MIKSRRMRRGKACSTHEECIEEFDGKARRKETTRKTRRRWEDNIKMYLREIRWGSMDLGQEPVQDSCDHDDEPSGYRKLW
jgi:hypothetical protein